MPNTRHFAGRDDKGRSAASEIIRYEMQKKGKLSPTERYKRIMKKKLLENKNAAALANKSVGFRLPGSLQQERKMSAQAEKAMKEMAAKKAAKQAKADRRAVIIQPRNFSNGNLNKKGQIFDIAGNMVGQVNKKNGKMATMNGWSIGQYKPKSFGTNNAIQDAINKYSPYYINLRKMQAMQAGGGQDFGVFGPPPEENQGGMHRGNQGGGIFGPSPQNASLFDSYGDTVASPRQNIGVTAWGATSDNVWGTFSDNVWGTSTDNVWGGNSSDIWGGIGGNPFGSKSVRIWGTGNGKNYLKGLSNRVAAFFGLKVKSSQSASVRDALIRNARATRSGNTSATTTSRAPTRTR